MLPMNYAILKVFESGEVFDASAVMDQLSDQYGDFKPFRLANVIESLMAAEQNEILEKSAYELDEAGELHIYYRATEYGSDLIRRFI
jgi:DNA-binding PadR family transcriptional regulator